MCQETFEPKNIYKYHETIERHIQFSQRHSKAPFELLERHSLLNDGFISPADLRIADETGHARTINIEKTKAAAKYLLFLGEPFHIAETT